jgi:signal transduction histidine kinase
MEENLTRIFEPFFTTKPVGGGMGLGLSLSYNIIAKYGGNMEVQSKMGQGTRFVIHLPINGEIAGQIAGQIATKESVDF